MTELAQTMRSLVLQGISGAVVEMGCALGGSAIILAACKGNRELRVYDVFGLIPPPSQEDGPDVHERYAIICSGKSQGLKGDRYYGYEKNLLEKVRHHFVRMGYPPEQHQVRFIQGLYEQTLTDLPPIALAHIDCDWYDSVRLCLERVAPRVVQQGRIIIDDYDAYSGCKKAVDAFLSKNSLFFPERYSRLHLVRR